MRRPVFDSSKHSLSGPLKRPIRSFVLRQGRLTLGQKTALEQHWPAFGLDVVAHGQLDYRQTFGREAPVVLEIGYGMGHSLLSMAEQQPECDFIGVEVHRPGVGSLLAGIEARQLTNLRSYNDDVTVVLEHSIPDASLAAVQLFFPDPWPKRKHHKRRIVQPEFVERIAKKLQPDGYFHMATDWQPYAKHMLAVMNDAHQFTNQASDGTYVPRPRQRPETKFESRGKGLGHGVWDLLFQKL